MAEDFFIRHCSPTMAGIKTANLFVCEFSDENSLRKTLQIFNKKLVPKGLCILSLRYRKGKALLYVFRPRFLIRDIRNNQAKQILTSIGYPVENYMHCIRYLIERLKKQEDFPHEIGLFLGYPPEDVEGFINQGPHCAKCTGCWKVYGDEEEAKRKFLQYKQCTKAYKEAYQTHHSLSQLLVAVSS